MALVKAGNAPYQVGVNDVQLIALDGRYGTLDVSYQTTVKETGSGGVAMDLSANSKKGCVPIGAIPQADNINIYPMFVGYSGNLSQTCGLFTFSTQTPAATPHRFIEAQTDRSIIFKDKNDVPIFRLPSVVIATTGTKLHLVIDCLTLATVWVALCVDGDWKMGYDTGMLRADLFNTANGHAFVGEVLGASNPGVTGYLDNGGHFRSETATDVPHITACPNILIHERVAPDQAGSNAGWTGSGGGAGLFSEVDEMPNNGATDYWQSTAAAGVKNSVDGAAYNFGGGTVMPAATPFYSVVGAATAGGKDSPLALCRLSGGSESTSAFSSSFTTSYLAHGSAFSRPGGGDWVDTDFTTANTFEWGAQSVGTLGGIRISQAYGPSVPYYTSSLPLAPPPRQTAFLMAGLGGVL